MGETQKYFEGQNTPTRALGEMFMSRADELASCGRHPYFRAVCGYRHLFNSAPPDDVVKKTLVEWMKKIYSSQMGNIVRAGLALATSVKFASIMSNKTSDEDESGLTAAADCLFNSSGILNAVIVYFGSRTKWELVADALVDDGRNRWADADDAVFSYPDGDDPECSGEGPSLDDVKSALGGGGDNEDEEDAESQSVEKNPPGQADILAAFPGIKKRVKPSNN